MAVGVQVEMQLVKRRTQHTKVKTKNEKCRHQKHNSKAVEAMSIRISEHGLSKREADSLKIGKMMTPGYRVESTNRFLSLPSRPVTVPRYIRYPTVQVFSHKFFEAIQAWEANQIAGSSHHRKEDQLVGKTDR